MATKTLRRPNAIVTKARRAGADAIAKTKPTANIQLIVGLKSSTAAAIVKRLKMRRLKDSRGYQIYHGGLPSRTACRRVAAVLKQEGIFAMCTGRRIRGIHVPERKPKARKKPTTSRTPSRRAAPSTQFHDLSQRLRAEAEEMRVAFLTAAAGDQLPVTKSRYRLAIPWEADVTARLMIKHMSPKLRRGKVRCHADGCETTWWAGFKTLNACKRVQAALRKFTFTDCYADGKPVEEDWAKYLRWR